MVYNTDKLQNMIYDADEQGVPYLVQRRTEDVIEYIEIDGEEFFNEVMYEELEGWERDAERGWRE